MEITLGAACHTMGQNAALNIIANNSGLLLFYKTNTKAERTAVLSDLCFLFFFFQFMRSVLLNIEQEYLRCACAVYRNIPFTISTITVVWSNFQGSIFALPTLFNAKFSSLCWNEGHEPQLWLWLPLRLNVLESQ